MSMNTVNGSVSISSKGFNDIVDITGHARVFVRRNQLIEGQLLTFINGSTAGITTIEYEPGLIQDLPDLMEKIAPMNKTYHHDATWHDGNGYAHLRSALMGTSFTAPVIDEQLVLGTWQQIILVDFDNRPRNRQVVFQFVGSKNQ